MPRTLCSVCLHPSQTVRDWFDQGKSITYICFRAPEPKLLPSDIEFHSRHSSRKIQLAESTAGTFEVGTGSIAEIRQSLEQHAREAKQGYRLCAEKGDATGAGKFDVSYRNCLMSIAELDQKQEKAEQESKKQIVQDGEKSAIMSSDMEGAPSVAWVDAVVRKVRAAKAMQQQKEKIEPRSVN